MLHTRGIEDNVAQQTQYKVGNATLSYAYGGMLQNPCLLVVLHPCNWGTSMILVYLAKKGTSMRKLKVR